MMMDISFELPGNQVKIIVTKTVITNYLHTFTICQRTTITDIYIIRVPVSLTPLHKK